MLHVSFLNIDRSVLSAVQCHLHNVCLHMLISLYSLFCQMQNAATYTDLGRLSNFAVVSIILRHSCFVAQVVSTSASTSSALNVDQSVTDKDDFAAWDDDTQKQWKRFMKGSRSQEVCCHMLLLF